MPNVHKIPPISIRVPVELRDWLVMYAAYEGVSVNRVVVEAIEAVRHAFRKEAKDMTAPADAIAEVERLIRLRAVPKERGEEILSTVESMTPDAWLAVMQELYSYPRRWEEDRCGANAVLTLLPNTSGGH